jgi:hypothetical protein
VTRTLVLLHGAASNSTPLGGVLTDDAAEGLEDPLPRPERQRRSCTSRAGSTARAALQANDDPFPEARRDRSHFAVQNRRNFLSVYADTRGSSFVGAARSRSVNAFLLLLVFVSSIVEKTLFGFFIFTII